jgi:hypothetical protein
LKNLPSNSALFPIPMRKAILLCILFLK